MTKSISPRFIKSLQLNIDYWTKQLDQAGNHLIRGFSIERENLLIAVHYGTLFEDTHLRTALLLTKLFPSIEQRREVRSWIHFYEFILNYKTRLDLQLRWELENRLGQGYRLLGKKKEAIQIHQTLNEEIKHLAPSSFIWIRVLFNLCEDFRLSQKPGEAKTYALMALEELDDKILTEPTVTMQASLMNSIGLIYSDVGEYQEAIRHLELSYQSWQSIDKAWSVECARTTHSLGHVYRVNGQFEQAERWIRVAISIFDETKSQLEMVRAQNSLGVLYESRGDHIKAIELFQRCLDSTPDTHKEPSIFGSIYHNLANNYLMIHQFSKAENYFRLAISDWNRCDDKLNLGNSIGGLGEAFEGQSRFKEALVAYDEAVAILLTYPQNVWAVDCLNFFRERLENLEE